MKTKALRYEDGNASEVVEHVSDERAYTISLNAKKIASFAASPMDLEELAAGYAAVLGWDAEEIDVSDRDISVQGVRAGDRERSDVVFGSDAILRSIALLGSGDEWKKTGGAHAAYLVSDEGLCLCGFEDIGRRNTLYKVFGWCFLNQVGLGDKFITYTGRISGDIVDMASALKLPMLVSRAAPLSRAVCLGEALDVTVVGFARDKRFTVYTHPERVALDD